jgi:predicted phosphate transport protein (TIGR00153 family)
MLAATAAARRRRLEMLTPSSDDWGKETRVILRFFTRQFNFFDRFEEQVGHAVEAARFFREIVAQDRVGEEMLSKMAQIEHQGDDAAHTIIEQLNKTFITPFDREDIHALAMELDDITDMINNIVRRLKVYDITGVDKNMVEFATVIEQSVQAVARAVGGLRHIKNVRVVFDACVEVNRLENVGDAMRDRVLAELFATTKDPIVVLKWKDIYQDAETVLDVCEDVVHVVDSIMVKQA